MFVDGSAVIVLMILGPISLVRCAEVRVVRMSDEEIYSETTICDDVRIDFCGFVEIDLNELPFSV